MRPISAHLCFSSSVSLFLPLSLKSSTPESPKTPESPWDLEWMTDPTNKPFCTLSYKDTDETPLPPSPKTQKNLFSWSALLRPDPYSEQQLNTLTHAHRHVIDERRMEDGFRCLQLSHFFSMFTQWSDASLRCDAGLKGGWSEGLQEGRKEVQPNRTDSDGEVDG